MAAAGVLWAQDPSAEASRRPLPVRMPVPVHPETATCRFKPPAMPAVPLQASAVGLTKVDHKPPRNARSEASAPRRRGSLGPQLSLHLGSLVSAIINVTIDALLLLLVIRRCSPRRQMAQKLERKLGKTLSVSQYPIRGRPRVKRLILAPSCLLRVIRVRGRPEAGRAMSASPRKRPTTIS